MAIDPNILALLANQGPSPLAMGQPGSQYPGNFEGPALNPPPPVTPMRPEDLIVSPNPSNPHPAETRMEGFRRQLTDFTFSLGSGLAAASVNPRGRALRTQAGIGATLQVPKILQDQIDAQKLADAQKAQAQDNFLQTLSVQKKQADTAAANQLSLQDYRKQEDLNADAKRLADAAKADELARLKQQEIDNKTKTDAATLRVKGFKRDPNGVIVDIPESEMSAKELADLKESRSRDTLRAAQTDLAEATAEWRKRQADPNDPQYELALARLRIAQQNADTAVARLGISRENTDIRQATFEATGGISPDRQKMQANAQSGLRAVEKVRSELKKPNILAKAALPGSPEARTLIAARNEMVDVLTRLRTGAALNEEEQKFYNNQAPQLLDTLFNGDAGTIEYKLSIFEDQFKALAGPNKSSLPARTPSKTTEKPIELERGPDGKLRVKKVMAQRTAIFEGKTYTIPTDATDAEVIDFISNQAGIPTTPKTPPAKSEAIKTFESADYVRGNKGFILNPRNPNAKAMGTVKVLDNGVMREVPIDPNRPAALVPGLIEGHIRNKESILERLKRTPISPGFTTDVGNLAEGLKYGAEGAGRVLSGIAQSGIGYDPQSPVLGTAANIAKTVTPAFSILHPSTIPQNLVSTAKLPATMAGHMATAGVGAIKQGITLAGSAAFPETMSEIPASQVAAGQSLPEAAAVGGIADMALNSAPVRALKQDISSYLAEKAAENKAKALQPTTLQGRADALQIAPELSERGIGKGLTQKHIDQSILNDVSMSGQRVQSVESRLAQEARPEFQFTRQTLVDEINSAEAQLNIPRSPGTAPPEAINHLEAIKAKIAKLPEHIDFDQMIALRRQLDDVAERSGAFNGAQADSLKADMYRGVADLTRSQLNGVDSELRAANHDFSVKRRAADIVERRQLAKVGKIDSGIPGRGGILDDILATWAGRAAGGPIGGVIAETTNLARQTPGWANLKSAFEQRLANSLKQPLPQPRAYIPSRAGGPHASPMPDSSGVTITTTPSRAVSGYEALTETLKRKQQ